MGVELGKVGVGLVALVFAHVQCTQSDDSQSVSNQTNAYHIKIE